MCHAEKFQILSSENGSLLQSFHLVLFIGIQALCDRGNFTCSGKSRFTTLFVICASLINYMVGHALQSILFHLPDLLIIWKRISNNSKWRMEVCSYSTR